MVDQSPRFGLNNNYAQGEDNWDHDDTVDLLDKVAEKRDVIANRPASGTYDNEVYFATDENIYYRWDAGTSSWVAVGGKGSSGSPLPGTSYRDSIRSTKSTDIQINVPSDYATLADAVLAATEYVEPREDVNVVVNIETGHVIETNLKLEFGNFGYITITSEDATVSLGSGFPTSENVLWVWNAVAPKWDVHVDAAGYGNGGLGYRAATGTITSGSGVINSGDDGLIAQSAVIYANSSDFSGAANDGADVAVASKVHAQSADFSGAGNRGFYISRVSEAALDGADLRNATNEGLLTRRSRVHADSANANGAGSHGFEVLNGSVVSAIGATADSVGNHGARVRDASTFDANNFSADGCTNGIRALDGCTANIRNATIANTSGVGIRMEDGNQVNAIGASLSTIGVGNVVTGSVGDLVTLANVTLDGSAIAAGDTNYGSFNAVESTGIAFQ